MKIIKTKRVIVTREGSEFDSPGAFKRHQYQSSIGKARTTVQIRRADQPLKFSLTPQDSEAVKP